MELTTSWKQEGLQEGLKLGFQQGRQEGRQEGELTLVRRLLQRRFAPLTETDEHHLQQLSLAQIEALADALLEFQKKEDLTAWFNRLETSQEQSKQ